MSDIYSFHAGNTFIVPTPQQLTMRRRKCVKDNCNLVPKKDYADLGSREMAMHNLRSICYERLKSPYWEKTPYQMVQRLEEELDIIEKNGYAYYFLLMRAISEQCNLFSTYHSALGDAGASYVCYLLGITPINPLPSHYYCPGCRRVEFVEQGSWSADGGYEVKTCPVCGCKMGIQGDNIPHQSFWGASGKKFPKILMLMDASVAFEMWNYAAETLHHNQDWDSLEIRKVDLWFSSVLTTWFEYTYWSEKSDIDMMDVLDFVERKHLPEYMSKYLNKDKNTFADYIQAFALANNKYYDSKVPQLPVYVIEDLVDWLKSKEIPTYRAFILADYIANGSAKNGFKGKKLALLRQHNVTDAELEQLANIKKMYYKSMAILAVRNELVGAYMRNKDLYEVYKEAENRKYGDLDVDLDDYARLYSDEDLDEELMDKHWEHETLRTEITGHH